MSSTRENEVARPMARHHIVHRRDYDLVGLIIHYDQTDRIIGKPKFLNGKAEGNLKKAESEFMMYLKTLIHKALTDPKLLELKICLRGSQKRSKPRRIFSGFHRMYRTVRFPTRGGQHCSIQRAKETSGCRITFWTTWLGENAGRE